MKTTFKAAHAGRMTAHQRSTAFEKEVDKLESRIRDKLDVTTGFADEEVKARRFEQMLRARDRSRSGYLTYKEFFCVLTNFNFVGVQREIEALFNRYDQNASGVVGCHEFAYSLYGLEGRIILDSNSKATADKIVMAILDRHGGLGVANFLQTIRAMDRDGQNLIPRQELLGAIREFGALRVSSTDLTSMLDRLDANRMGMINLPELLRALKCGMSNERTNLVIDLFHRFNQVETGIVAADEIYNSFDRNSHPNVVTGKTSSLEADRAIRSYFQGGVYVAQHITIAEFMDFYFGISLMIEDDEFFELSIRNSWYSRDRGVGLGNTSTTRRFNVSRDDGGADTLELRDDLSVQVFDKSSVANKLQRRGVSGILDVTLN